KLQLGLSTTPLNLDYLEFCCRQELYLLQALSNHALQELFDLVKGQLELPGPSVTVEAAGTTGRPKMLIEEQRLKEMLHTQLPVPCIATLMGVSRSTVFRRKKEYDLSVRSMYSTINDDELDSLVASIKNDLPNAGYWMVRGRLESMGRRVQWRRVAASMHRVDSLGVISRLSGLGCVVRRVYSVPGPLSLVHVDTNHKLIRFTVIEMIYFVLNLHRIERLWRDVWISVSSKYYNLLHSLEENELLDISCADDIFCVHYAILPRLKRDLEIFTEGWNHHPLCTEGNRSPTQIWEIAQMLNTNTVCCGLDSETGIIVPEYECPLVEEMMTELQTLVDPTDPNITDEQLYIACYEHIKRLQTHC
uniref:Integrase core domain-containing protein n=1 Tax=Sinocyclocheilus anshuiensis TaxID=1608454 RepID=A0A671PPR6_9TELE